MASGFTVIVPFAFTWLQIPVVVTLKLNVPETVGVPLIVNIPPLKIPVIPVGNPVTFAPVPPPPILYVIFVKGVLIP